MAHVRALRVPAASSVGGLTLPAALRRPSPRVVALVVAGCAAAVTVPGALGYSFWQDEIASARVIDQSTPWGALDQIGRTEATPPAWYLIAWVAHHLGVSMAGVRVLSAASVVLTAALVVVYAARLLSPWAAGLAGMLVAFGWQFVFHGRELRAYALLGLVSVLFALLLENAARDPSRRRLALLSACVVVGSTTHYFFLFTLAAGAVWLLLAPRPNRAKRRVIVAGALGLVPLILWVPVLAHQYAAARFAWIGPFKLQTVVENVWLTFARGFPPHHPLLRAVLASLALAVVLAGAVVLSRHRERGRLCALFAVLPVLLAALVWLAGPRVFVARNLIGTGPFAAVAIAAAASRAPRRAGIAVGALLVAATVVGVTRTERAPPWPYDRVAAAVVAEGWTPASPIVIAAAWPVRPPLAWYLPGHPRLFDTLPLPRTCSSTYVVASRGSSWWWIAQSGLVVRQRTVGQFLVARLRPTTPARALALMPEAMLVVAEGGTVPCVQPVER